MARVWLLTLVGLLRACTLVNADAVYTKNSPVLQVNAKNYDSLIAQSNQTTILEFYAPWCGHCQSLKPAYEKAAKNLAGLAKVAAINCDDAANKPFCGQMGVQGFPTLKIVRPGTKPGRPVVEDYQGPRTVKAIVDAVVDKIPNHVKRLQGTGLDSWLEDISTPAKAIVFTERGTTSALIKSLAVDFLGSIGIAQIRSKETAAVEKYGITTFPSIVLVPGQGKDPIVYSDEMKKEPLVIFFSQVAAPNLDPAPKPGTASKLTNSPKSAAKSSSASTSFSRASESHKSTDSDNFMGASTIILDDNVPTESPLPIVEPEQKPIVVPDVLPTIPTLSTPAELEAACIAPKSGTCILVLLPASGAEAVIPKSASQALASLADLADKHTQRRAHIFPFYGIPAENERAKIIRSELGLKSDAEVEVIALNNKRGWWRQYTATEYTAQDLESFVDSVKLGEGSKLKLPVSFGEEPASLADAAVNRDLEDAPIVLVEDVPEPTLEPYHGEL